MKLSPPSFGPFALEHLQVNRWFRLTVAGLVSRTQQFSMQGLQDYFSERTFLVSQIGDIPYPEERKIWRGCTLNELLDFVGVSAQARYIEFVGHIRYPDLTGLKIAALPIEELERTQIGLVWEKGGEPVTIENGGPLVALLPGEKGLEEVRGLTRINLIIVPAL